MRKNIIRVLAAVLLAVISTAMAWAQAADACAPTPVKLGPTNPKNGFPLWVEDSRGIRVELCQEGTGATTCFFDPIIQTNPYSVQTGMGAETFWFLADALMNEVQGVFVFGVEAAWAAEDPIPGDQFPFIRFRFRFDALPAMGRYTITHPWGTEEFDTVWDAKNGVVDRIFVTHDSQFGNNGFAKGKHGPFPVPAVTTTPYLLPGATGTFTLPANFNAAQNPACTRNTLRLTGVYRAASTCINLVNNNTGLPPADTLVDDDEVTVAQCTARAGQPIDFDPTTGVRTVIEQGTFSMVSGKAASRVGVDHFQSAYVNTGGLRGVEVFAKALSKTGAPNSNLVAVVEGTPTEFSMSTSVDSRGRYFAFIPSSGLAGFGTTANDQVTVINKSDPDETGLAATQFQSRASRIMTDVVDIRTTYWWSTGINVNKLELVARTTNTLLNPACPLNAWAGITTGGASDVRLKAFHLDGEFIADLATSTTQGWSVFHPTTNPPHKVVIRSCFGGRSEADVEMGIPVAR